MMGMTRSWMDSAAPAIHKTAATGTAQRMPVLLEQEGARHREGDEGEAQDSIGKPQSLEERKDVVENYVLRHAEERVANGPFGSCGDGGVSTAAPSQRAHSSCEGNQRKSGAQSQLCIMGYPCPSVIW